MLSFPFSFFIFIFYFNLKIFLNRRPLFCFVHRHCSPRVRFPCHTLGGTTKVSSRCQYLHSLSWKLEMFWTQDQEIKLLAHCSFICIYFLRSILPLMIIDVHQLSTTKYANSWWRKQTGVSLASDVSNLINSPSIIIKKHATITKVVNYELSNTDQELRNSTTICYTVYTNTLPSWRNQHRR